MTTTTYPSLQLQLDAFAAGFVDKVPAEIRTAMRAADADLLASGITATALKAGDKAPDFALTDVHGQTETLAALLRQGPVVVSFYRGGWCPYCNLELRALQQILPEMQTLDASLVAISPEKPDESLSTAEKNELAFPVLSDLGSKVAAQFGIAFDLAEALRPIYTQLGHGLPDRNGDDSWQLPIPATYVIGRDGIIRFAFVDTDYRSRLEPAAILDALASLHAA